MEHKIRVALTGTEYDASYTETFFKAVSNLDNYTGHSCDSNQFSVIYNGPDITAMELSNEFAQVQRAFSVKDISKEEQVIISTPAVGFLLILEK